MTEVGRREFANQSRSGRSPCVVRESFIRRAASLFVRMKRVSWLDDTPNVFAVAATSNEHVSTASSASERMSG